MACTPLSSLALSLFCSGGEDGGTDVRWEGADALDEGGGLPESLVGVPLAVYKHAGAADAVLGEPENFGLREVGSHRKKLRRGGENGGRARAPSWFGDARAGGSIGPK